VIAWILVVVYRGVFDASDQVSRWVLGALTLAVIVLTVIGLWNFVDQRARAKRRGERVLTASTIAVLLVGLFIVGLVVRFAVGGDEPDGLVAWVGGVLGLLALLGLFILGFLRERSRANARSFLFDPHWKYGLLLIAILAMVVFALTTSDVLASVAVLCFWLALAILAGRALGRWIVSSRRKSSNVVS
jgi:hypothetical protein